MTARRRAPLLVLLALAGAAPGMAGPPDFYRGMHLGLYARSHPDFIRAGLAEMQELGVDTVSIVIPQVTPDVRSRRFRRRRDVTPEDRTVVRAIRQAHGRGMRVMLFPLVLVEQVETGQWRGTLRPADWGAWFRRYERLLRPYARIAEAEGVELLCVGVELGSSEEHEDRWRNLITKMRRIYSGKLLYSANWDHYEGIGFIDALDYSGINAYYRLTDDPRPTVEKLLEGWRPIRKALVSWSLEQGKPLLFTEVGYPSRVGAGIDPWNYGAQRPVSLEEQRRCYRAFIEAWRDVPELSGTFFYYWWGPGGPDDADYTPRGKPAAAEVAGWYGGASPRGREVEPRSPKAAKPRSPKSP